MAKKRPDITETFIPVAEAVGQEAVLRNGYGQFEGEIGWTPRTDDYYIKGHIIKETNDNPIICKGPEGYKFLVKKDSRLIEPLEKMIGNFKEVSFTY